MRLKRRVSTYKENPINFIKYYHMGAVCCASNKPKHKRQDVYQDTQTGNIHPVFSLQYFFLIIHSDNKVTSK